MSTQWLERRCSTTGTEPIRVLAGVRGASFAFEAGSSAPHPGHRRRAPSRARSFVQSAATPVTVLRIVVAWGPLPDSSGPAERRYAVRGAQPAGFWCCPKCRTPKRCGLSHRTGIAPFLSILRTGGAVAQVSSTSSLVHAVRNAKESC